MSFTPPSAGQDPPKQTVSASVVPARDPWSLHLVTVAGIPIRLHITFLFFLVWIGVAGPSHSDGLSLAFVGAVFACVVLHELGHSVVALRDGIPVSSITLYPIGGVAAIEKQPKPKQELWIALAGPAVNIVIGGVILLAIGTPSWNRILYDVTHHVSAGRLLAEKVLLANILLCLFNLIPAFPMDGGRVLRALLAMHLPAVQATQLAAWIGQFIAVAAGLLALLSGDFWFLLIAFFVYIGAGQEAGAYRQAVLMEGVTVRDAMITDVRTLSVGSTLKEAADVLLDTSQHDFPVIHGSSVQGVLTRNDLLRGLSQQGPSGYVAGAMNRQYAFAGPDDDLGAMLPRLQANPGPLIIIENDQLLGIVTADNIQEFLAIRQISVAQAQHTGSRMV